MEYSYTQTHQDDQQQHNQYQQEQEQQQYQSYDHSSYQSYYPYNHPQQQFDHQYQQYYNPTTTTTTTTTSYDASATHHQYQHEPTSIHPPGVPIPPDPPQSADLDHTHLQNAYYARGVAEDQLYQQHQQMNAGSGGLMPAAVAALSQLSQLSANMDAAQRAIQPPIGQTPYRGGGRRGNRPFRGGGRGHFGYRGPRPDGSAPSFRGRGRGQGGGRHFTQYGAASSNPNSASVPAEGVAASMQSPSALVPGQPPLPVPTQVSSASFWRPPRMAWCELCRVDCNTPEILEQHKNGKRHKKNMQVHEELQKLNKVNTEQKNAQMPNTELKPEVGHLVNVEGFEEKQPFQENLTSEVVTDDNRNETDQKDMGAKSEASAEPGTKSEDHFAARGRGLKRRMRGSRGGKYMRTNEGSRRPVEPPKPKQVIPFICELCNVKCESQVVFDSHLSGKKHLATLKRFNGHRALFGEVGLQALYPAHFSAASASAASALAASASAAPAPAASAPAASASAASALAASASATPASAVSTSAAPASAASTSAAPASAASTSAAPPVQQGGVNDPPVLLAQLLMTYVLSQPQGQGTEPAPGIASAVTPAPGTGFGTQNQVESQIQRLQALCQEGNQDGLIMELRRQLQYTTPGNTDTNTGNGTSVFEANEASISINTSVVVSAENPVTSERVSVAASENECGAASSDPFVQSKSENQM